MTTNTTQLTVELATFARTRRRARVTFPCVVGFVAGCAAGAVFKRHPGLRALVLPVALTAIIVPLRELMNDGHATQPASNGEMSDGQRSPGFLTNSNS